MDYSFFRSYYKEDEMKLPKNPLTQEEFEQAKTAFLAECEKGVDGIVRHKSCHSPIRTGYMNCFKATADGTLDPGDDGCGIGPVRVPYCERCDPPDGFNYTYAIRVGILPRRQCCLDIGM